MGAVICYGTLLTMFFILTVMPIAYWKVMGLAEKSEEHFFGQITGGFLKELTLPLMSTWSVICQLFTNKK